MLDGLSTHSTGIDVSDLRARAFPVPFRFFPVLSGLGDTVSGVADMSSGVADMSSGVCGHVVRGSGFTPVMSSGVTKVIR